MTKTTNYQLNQWAKSDRILMDDFNADNAKLDAALKAEETARKNAVSAEASDRAAAINIEAAARERDVRALDNALILKTRPELIRSGTSDGNVSIISLNVSGVDWSRYIMALFQIRNGQSLSCFLRCNGGGTHKSLSGSMFQGDYLALADREESFFSLLPVACSAESQVQLFSVGSFAELGRYAGKLRQCSSFSLEAGGVKLENGLVFSLWGVR